MKKRSDLVLDGKIVFDNNGVVLFNQSDASFVFQGRGIDLLKISPDGFEFSGGEPVPIQTTQILSTECVNLPLGQQPAEDSVCVVMDELPLEVTISDPKDPWRQDSPVWYLVRDTTQNAQFGTVITWDTPAPATDQTIAIGLNFSWIIDSNEGGFTMNWGDSSSSLSENDPMLLYFDQKVFCEIRSLRDIIGICDNWTIIPQASFKIFQGNIKFSSPFFIEQFSIVLPSAASTDDLRAGNTTQLSIGLSARFDDSA